MEYNKEGAINVQFYPCRHWFNANPTLNKALAS